jgi:membrane protease YdiL (CAAX protease family)
MRSLVRTVVVLLVTAAAYFAFRMMGDSSRVLPGAGIDPDLVEALLKVGFWVVPSALAVRVLQRVGYGRVVAELGLRRRVVAGYGLGLAAMLPMAVLVAAVGPSYFRVVSFAGIALVGPFAEEVLFRGFLLRQLYRRCGWPPVWAIVASALAFGLAHLSNVDWFGPGLISAVASEMLTTIGGGLLFGWIAWRWDSIWPAIGLHSCLNLAWALTGASYGTLVAYRLHVPPPDGVLLVNTMRFAAVVIALGVTFLATRTARRARPSAADVTAAYRDSSLGSP